MLWNWKSNTLPHKKKIDLKDNLNKKKVTSSLLQDKEEAFIL